MKYLYFKLYQIFDYIGSDRQPEIPAMPILCVIQGIYIMDCVEILDKFGIISLQLGSLEIVLMYVAMMIINYFYLVLNIRPILNKYKNESPRKSALGFLYLFIFTLFAVLLIMVW